MEFEVNKFITLKLEDGKTIIYVNNKSFLQCKYLAFNIPLRDVQEYETIQSIDEMESSDRSRQYYTLDISPKQEFWGHCSNMQAWAENNYDTCLLHRNLVFPLLKELTDVGDLVAKRLFKDEIAKRMSSGHLPVILYLIENDYLSVMNKEEIQTFFPECEFIEYNNEIIPVLHGSLDYAQVRMKKHLKNEDLNRFVSLQKLFIVLKNVLDLTNRNIKDMDEIKGLENLSSLEELHLCNNQLTSISNKIFNLKRLKILLLNDNRLTSIPESISRLSSLETLNLENNQLSSLPNSLNKLTSLEELILNDNHFTSVPECINKLRSLQTLYLQLNQLKSLPEWIGKLKSLRQLYLTANELKFLPELSIVVLVVSIRKVMLLNEQRSHENHSRRV